MEQQCQQPRAQVLRDGQKTAAIQRYLNGPACEPTRLGAVAAQPQRKPQRAARVSAQSFFQRNGYSGFHARLSKPIACQSAA